MKRKIIKASYLLCLLTVLLALNTGVHAKEKLIETDVATQSPQDLPASVNKLLKKYAINKKDLSVYVKDLNANSPIISINTRYPRNPASTMKLLTTYAALKILKPNYTWKTEAWIRGKLEDGVLDGDLILKGYGDPFLIHQNYWKFVHGIKDSGLREIKGKVIIDNSYFTVPDIDNGKFDNRPFRTYNAKPSALMYNHQATRFFFKPDVINKRVDVIPFPLIPEVDYENEVKWVKGRCKRSHYFPVFTQTSTPAKKALKISGQYSEKCKDQHILRVLSKPAEHAFNSFRGFWQEMGGKVSGEMAEGTVQEGDIKLHTYYSDSLGSLIRVINKWSNNVMTRQLLLSLGAKQYSQPGTVEKGQRAILQTLEDNGIDIKGIIIDNGSGLSRIAKITTQQHARLLERAWRDEFMPEFLSSLSLPGLDGTLTNRFRDEEMQGRSHMKTGSLKNTKSIAGYMLTRKGKWLVVVMHHNGPKIGGGRGTAIQNAMLRWAFEQ